MECGLTGLAATSKFIGPQSTVMQVKMMLEWVGE
ncbi:hypothetical protein H5410_042505 [Solanum commersonii]|uniref:Uncharacterized protein n=1 Tax=Solanum commersonii TaxID=4109 RepID=A0A9J5XWJ8_SOLCO|nr:hypothetical protein H5410_042505 [Solanum commersonii]